MIFIVVRWKEYSLNLALRTADWIHDRLLKAYSVEILSSKIWFECVVFQRKVQLFCVRRFVSVYSQPSVTANDLYRFSVLVFTRAESPVVQLGRLFRSTGTEASEEQDRALVSFFREFLEFSSYTRSPSRSHPVFRPDDLARQAIRAAQVLPQVLRVQVTPMTIVPDTRHHPYPLSLRSPRNSPNGTLLSRTKNNIARVNSIVSRGCVD